MSACCEHLHLCGWIQMRASGALVRTMIPTGSFDALFQPETTQSSASNKRLVELQRADQIQQKHLGRWRQRPNKKKLHFFTFCCHCNTRKKRAMLKSQWMKPWDGERSHSCGNEGLNWCTLPTETIELCQQALNPPVILQLTSGGATGGSHRGHRGHLKPSASDIIERFNLQQKEQVWTYCAPSNTLFLIRVRC